ncbi:MAG: hypothetical protein FJX64_09250 [Alphaproteobacteria bacterium]|nr:hypothetical protein [Alphaproteobacteria bacterium]
MAILPTVLVLPALAQPAMPPEVRQAVGLPAPAVEDVAGWDVTRWGMSADELAAALGPRLVGQRSQIGLMTYSLAEAEIGGVKFAPVQLTLNPGRGLTEVRFGNGFVNRVREAEARAVEEALRAAYGEPHAIQANEDRTANAVREAVRSLAWNFPSTIITFRHALVAGGADGTQDLLTVSFLRPR